MMMHAVFLLGVCAVASAVEQVHIGFGGTYDVINVGWVDPNVESSVQWGSSASDLSSSSKGSTTSFVDGGSQKRTITLYAAQMTGLLASSRYYYRVGTPGNFSTVFSFKTAPPAGQQLAPMKFLVFGDMGVANAQSLKGITADAQGQEWDYAIDVGDFAYNMDSSNGETGDIYFRNVEQAHANLPFLVCPGNHEGAYNFSHYTYRWNTNPVNSGVLPAAAGANVAGQPNNWWYSVDIGLAHIVSFSTEVFFNEGGALVDSMLAWIEADIKKAQANRGAVPWIIVFGHRSVYCSCDSDCDGPAETVRAGLEPIMYTYGVDFFINGHEHNYERLYATYQNKYVAGGDNRVEDAAAPVYVVTGDAGNSEGHEPFTKDQPDWSAFRSNTFGYSRMVVHNSTHLYWEQVMTDNGEPAKDYGKIIDHMWLVQHNHGPFATGPNKPSVAGNGVSHTTHLSRRTGLDGPGHKHKFPSQQ